jgi:putative membrane protein
MLHRPTAITLSLRFLVEADLGAPPVLPGTRALQQWRETMPTDTRNRMPRGDLSNVRTVQQYAAQAIGRAELARAASEAAMEKATRPDIRELAGYELMEAKAMISVLRELGASAPQMAPEARGVLDMITSSSKGNAFDRAYITAQCENHAYLRDLTAAYLENSDPRTSDARERQGRQLATLALCTFTEHAATANRISRDLRA